MTGGQRTRLPIRGQRDFTLLWGGQAVSQLGSRIYGVAYLLWILSATGSPARAGLVTSVTIAAYTAAQVPAGSLADRCDRRLVMMTCDAIAMACVLSVAGFAAAAWFNMAQMLAAAAGLGAAWAVRPIAEAASMPDLVPEETVATAVGLTQSRAWVMGLLGPPLGGLLFGIWHPLPFFVDALSYLTALACVSQLRTPLHHAGTASVSTLADLREGFIYFRKVSFIRTTAVQAAVMGFVINAAGLVMLDLLRHHSASPGGTGLVFGIGAGGGCLGAILAPFVIRRFRTPRWALVLAPMTGALGLAGLDMAGSGPAMGVADAVLFMFQPLWMAVSEPRWLTLVPEAVRGRVRSTVGLVISVPLVVASVVTGVMIEHLGDASTCAALAAVMGAVAVGSLRACRYVARHAKPSLIRRAGQIRGGGSGLPTARAGLAPVCQSGVNPVPPTARHAGDGYAAARLADLLADRGDLDGAVQILRVRADTGDGYAAMRLARLLADRGDLDELRARADHGNEDAARELATRGDLDELRARADAGGGYAAQRLPDLMAEQGRGEEAARLCRFGFNPDGSIASA